MAHNESEPRPAQIEREILRLFSQDLRSKLYTYLRLRLSPLLAIEPYVPRAGRIVDLGCGCGIFANILYLGSKDREIVGFDNSARRIEVARSVSGNSKRLSFEVGDVNDVALGRLQIVTLIDLLHHMPYDNQNRLLSKIADRLHAGGVVIIKDLEKSPCWKYIFHYVQDSISYRGSRLYFRSARSMVGLLESLGLAVETVSLASGYPHPHVLYRCTKREANPLPAMEVALS